MIRTAFITLALSCTAFSAHAQLDPAQNPALAPEVLRDVDPRTALDCMSLFALWTRVGMQQFPDNSHANRGARAELAFWHAKVIDDGSRASIVAAIRDTADVFNTKVRTKRASAYMERRTDECLDIGNTALLAYRRDLRIGAGVKGDS